MSKRLFIGNLPYDATEEEIKELFAQHGAVVEVTLISDRATGRKKGFGFVEMENDAEADKAVEALNGQEFKGRPMVANVARPREERSDSFSGRRDFGRDRRGGGRNRY